MNLKIDRPIYLFERQKMTYIMEAKTIQANAFKTLIEALKEILNDANLEFDEYGIKIKAMDSSHTVLVYLKLESGKFESYKCYNKIIIGVSMINFFKLIKTMCGNDTLTLFIEEDNPNVLGIKLENGEKNSVTTYRLNLMDLNEEDLNLPPASFDSVITMPSVDFQKYCRDMHQFAEIVEIKSIGSLLYLSCKGDFASQESIIGEADCGISFVQNTNPNEIVQGLFALKHLVMFTKCTNLCQQIEILLKNDFPLIIKYQVASLGEIKLALAPQCNVD